LNGVALGGDFSTGGCQ